MLYLIVYLFDVYDKILFNLGTLKMGLCIVMIVTGCVAGGVWIMMQERRYYRSESNLPENFKVIYQQAERIGKKALKIFIALFIITAVLPTKQGLMVMGGVYVGKQVYDKVEQSELTEKAVKILNLELDNYLDKYIEEAQAKKEKVNK